MDNFGRGRERDHGSGKSRDGNERFSGIKAMLNVINVMTLGVTELEVGVR